MPTSDFTQEGRPKFEKIFTSSDSPLSFQDTHFDKACIHVPQGLTLEEVEKAVVLQTLDRYKGNRTQAAKALGISVRTLQRRLKCWGDGSLTVSQA